MKQWLAWACGGIVVLAVLVRVSTGQSQSASVRPARPTPATLASSQDADLRPPSPDAPAAEWQAYGKGLDRILSGHDPIAKFGNVPEARLTERRTAAAERRASNQKALQSASEASAGLYAEHAAKVNQEIQEGRSFLETKQEALIEAAREQARALGREQMKSRELPKVGFQDLRK